MSISNLLIREGKWGAKAKRTAKKRMLDDVSILALATGPIRSKRRETHREEKFLVEEVANTQVVRYGFQSCTDNRK